MLDQVINQVGFPLPHPPPPPLLPIRPIYRPTGGLC
jgi:hypothetical protein